MGFVCSIPEQVRRYLGLIHRHTPRDALLALTFIEPSGRLRNTFYQRAEIARAVDDAIQADTENVFARLTPMRVKPPRGRGVEADSLGTSVLWLDIDGVTDQQRVIDVLESVPQPPTMIICSGRGLHAYWLLHGFETDLPGIKARNRGLKYQVQTLLGQSETADSVFDLARVMRVAGTLNHKQTPALPCEIICYRPERVYRLTDFAPAQPVEDEPEVRDWEAEPIPDSFLDEIRARDVNLYNRILSETTARQAGAELKRGGRVDRSRNDIWIGVRVLGLGYSPGQALTILTHPEWFSGAKFRETRRWDYVYTTVAKARSRVPANPALYFDKRTFRPPWLGDELLAEYHFLYLDQLRQYRNGVFAPNDGENTHSLESLIADKLGDRWKPSHSAETIQYISE